MSDMIIKLHHPNELCPSPGLTKYNALEAVSIWEVGTIVSSVKGAQKLQCDNTVRRALLRLSPITLEVFVCVAASCVDIGIVGQLYFSLANLHAMYSQVGYVITIGNLQPVHQICTYYTWSMTHMS